MQYQVICSTRYQNTSLLMVIQTSPSSSRHHHHHCRRRRRRHCCPFHAFQSARVRSAFAAVSDSNISRNSIVRRVADAVSFARVIAIARQCYVVGVWRVCSTRHRRRRSFVVRAPWNVVRTGTAHVHNVDVRVMYNIAAWELNSSHYAIRSRTRLRRGALRT